MVAVMSMVVFVGAFALSASVIALAIGPQWRRIVRLAIGQAEHGYAPLHQLALAERRIAVRRWASNPVPAPLRRLHEAA